MVFTTADFSSIPYADYADIKYLLASDQPKIARERVESAKRVSALDYRPDPALRVSGCIG